MPINTERTPIFTAWLKTPFDRGLLATDYDGAKELVEAYLQADWHLRDAGRHPQLDVGAREQLRQHLLRMLDRAGSA